MPYLSNYSDNIYETYLQGLATSMSFSMIHREGGDANSKGLSDAASKGFSQASTDNLRDFG